MKFNHTPNVSGTFAAMGGFGREGWFGAPALRGMPVFAPEDGSGDGDANANANAGKSEEEAAAEAAAAAAAAKERPSENEAKLLREIMARKESEAKLKDQLKAFEGIDLEKVKSLMEAADKAEADKRKAEEDALKAAGEWDKLKERIVEEGKRERGALEAQLAERDSQLTEFQKTLRELTVGSAFASSAFVKDETLMTPRIARGTYESHFDVVDGKIVPYDGPRGAANRTPLVDGSGNALPFDEAMRRIVQNDPDRESIMRSRRNAGSGVTNRSEVTSGNEQQQDQGSILSPIDRIAAGLKAGGLTKQDAGLRKF